MADTSQSIRQALCELAAAQEGTEGGSKFWPAILPANWAGPFPRHWCGALALWCLHSIGCRWLWGFGGTPGFLWRLPHTKDPQPGDICYQAEPWQHHAILLARSVVSVGKSYPTISVDGNQGPAPGKCLRVHRAQPNWTTFYSIEPLVQAELDRKLAGDLAHD